MTTEPIEALIARQALHDLVVAYARAVDRGDEALLASIFHDDAEVVTGFIDGRGADYARAVVAMVRANLASSFHSIGSPYFELAGDAAAGETYVTAHVVSRGESPQATLMGGRYLDRFARRDGVWRIAHRHFVTDWSMSQPAPDGGAGVGGAEGGAGGFSSADPATGFWADARSWIAQATNRA